MSDFVFCSILIYIQKTCVFKRTSIETLFVFNALV